MSSPIIVADHHTAVGNVSRSGDGKSSARQYPIEIARALGSPLPRTRRPRRSLARIEEGVGFQFRAAIDARRAVPDPVGFLSTSEQVGFPLELINRGRRPHTLLAHNLVTDFKRRLHDCLGWLGWFDDVIVLSAALGTYLREDIGLDQDRVHVVRQGCDHQFFHPRADAEVDPFLVVSVGREHRDYGTLFRAFQRLPDAHGVVVSNSPWAKGTGPQSKHAGNIGRTPDNVELVAWVSDQALRDLYARAAVVVIPVLAGTTFAAGVNAVIEAQAMGKPVIVTETPGLSGYEDGATAELVPPGDPTVLAAAIERLLGDPSAACALGRRARTIVEDHRNIDTFAAEVRRIAETSVARRS